MGTYYKVSTDEIVNSLKTQLPKEMLERMEFKRKHELHFKGAKDIIDITYLLKRTQVEKVFRIYRGLKTKIEHIGLNSSNVSVRIGSEYFIRKPEDVEGYVEYIKELIQILDEEDYLEVKYRAPIHHILEEQPSLKSYRQYNRYRFKFEHIQEQGTIIQPVRADIHVHMSTTELIVKYNGLKYLTHRFNNKDLTEDMIKNCIDKVNDYAEILYQQSIATREINDYMKEFIEGDFNQIIHTTE